MLSTSLAPLLFDTVITDLQMMQSPLHFTQPSPSLKKRNSCVRMLFVDYSLAFNTTVPSRLDISSKTWAWILHHVNKSSVPSIAYEKGGSSGIVSTLWDPHPLFKENILCRKAFWTARIPFIATLSKTELVCTEYFGAIFSSGPNDRRLSSVKCLNATPCWGRMCWKTGPVCGTTQKVL